MKKRIIKLNKKNKRKQMRKRKKSIMKKKIIFNFKRSKN
jgi:hypothetical protein